MLPFISGTLLSPGSVVDWELRFLKGLSPVVSMVEERRGGVVRGVRVQVRMRMRVREGRLPARRAIGKLYKRCNFRPDCSKV